MPRLHSDPVPPGAAAPAGGASLSLVVITRNEAANIVRCLSSLSGLAQELIVVDSGSTDATRELAATAGARVLERSFDTFGRQKQYALEQATGDWVLCLDADEWLDETALAALAALLRAPPAAGEDGLCLRMRCHYLGRWLRHGPWSGERKLRLVRRGRARWSADPVHESLRLDAGRIGELPGHLLHRPYRDLNHQMEKIGRYTDLIAERDAGIPGHRVWLGVVVEPPLVFLHAYVLRLGLLDGCQGFLAAATHAWYFFLRYAKIGARRLQQRRHTE